MKGQVVKTFNITRVIDKMAEKYGLKLYETPIGFKYIADLILKEDILIGGEESGGIGVKGHIPERDGILNALLLMELVAYEKQPLGHILDKIMKEHGYFYYNRSDLKLEKPKEKIERLKKSLPKSIADKQISKVEDLDGLKLNFEDESWILFRASGTEPLLRVYVEARTPEDVAAILGKGEDLITSAGGTCE